MNVKYANTYKYSITYFTSVGKLFYLLSYDVLKYFLLYIEY